MKPIYPIKTFIVLAFMLLLAFEVVADEFEVKSFEKDENDLAARRYERMDINGEPCALVKIKTDLNGLSFDSGVGIVGDVEYKEGQYWVYLVSGERRLSIYKKDFIRLDYSIPLPVESYDVFHMVLTAKGQKIESLPVTFQITPSDAQLTVDGKSVENEHPVQLSIGKHSFLAERENYQTLTKTIKVNEKNVFFQLKLQKRKEVIIEISTNPSGATVFIDNVNFGKSPISSFYQPGHYKIFIRKKGYLDYKGSISIEGDKKYMEYDLEENSAHLKIITNSKASAKVNNKPFKINERIKVEPKIADIEITMPRAEKIEKTVAIKRNDDLTLNLFPIIKTGSIKVAVKPLNSKITLKNDIDEKYTSKGSNIFSNVPVGKYQLIVEKRGFRNHNEKLRLEENEIISKEISLKEGKKNSFLKGIVTKKKYGYFIDFGTSLSIGRSLNLSSSNSGLEGINMGFRFYGSNRFYYLVGLGLSNANYNSEVYTFQDQRTTFYRLEVGFAQGVRLHKISELLFLFNGGIELSQQEYTEAATYTKPGVCINIALAERFQIYSQLHYTTTYKSTYWDENKEEYNKYWDELFTGRSGDLEFEFGINVALN